MSKMTHDQAVTNPYPKEKTPHDISAHFNRVIIAK